MNLIGQAVRHKAIGKGIIIGMENNQISICFSDGIKIFNYPGAFLDELELRNNKLQKEIIAEIK